MVEEKSQADLLRDHLNLKIDQKFEFSNSEKVTADIQSFLQSNKDRKWELKKIRPSYNRILEQCAKNKKFTLTHLGKKTKRPKFNRSLQPDIQPKPAGAVAPASGGKPTTAPVVQYYDKEGKPIKISVVHHWENFDAEGVSASLNAFYIMIRVAYPELEALSVDEKQSLGKMWLPAFQRYLTENWAYIGIPFLATMGIMLPKVAQARKKHKAHEGVEGSPENRKAAEEEKKQKEVRDEIKCEWCGQKEKTWVDLKYHRRSCKKKPRGMSAI